MVYKHAVFAAFRIYAQSGGDDNYIVGHANHGIVFLNFCGNPAILKNLVIMSYG